MLSTFETCATKQLYGFIIDHGFRSESAAEAQQVAEQLRIWGVLLLNEHIRPQHPEI